MKKLFDVDRYGCAALAPWCILAPVGYTAYAESRQEASDLLWRYERGAYHLKGDVHLPDGTVLHGVLRDLTHPKHDTTRKG